MQLTATGTYSDQSTQDLTSSVSWTSADPTVATVTPAGGLVTCVSTASTATQSSFRPLAASVTGTVPVTCLAPTLSSITVTPQNQTLAAGSTLAIGGNRQLLLRSAAEHHEFGHLDVQQRERGHGLWAVW